MKRHLNKSLEQQNPIRALGEKANELLSNESIDKIELISLQLGNPQFKEAGSISEQMIEAITKGIVAYVQERLSCFINCSRRNLWRRGWNENQSFMCII